MPNCTAAETQLKAQNILLGKIAQGHPLSDILNTLIVSVEQQQGSALGSILLLDRNNCLRHGAAPNLPADYNQAIDGTTIGEGICPCGTAIFYDQTIIVPDIATDAICHSYRKLARKHNLIAYWSTPILASNGSILGILAIYYREVRAPSNDDIDYISQMLHIAGIAIERQRANDSLNVNKAIVSESQHTGQIGYWELAIPSQVIRWSPDLTRIFGLVPLQSPLSFAEWLHMVHPDDRSHMEQSIHQVIADGQSFTEEYRFVRPDGALRHHEYRAQVERDSHGQTIRLFGTIFDITERKETKIVLQKLGTGIATTPGQNLFPVLVRHIAEALEVDYAGINEYIPDTLHTLAFWGQDGFQLPESHLATNTPCEKAIQAGTFYCANNVQKQFPHDQALIDFEVESYLGIALQNTQGQIIGNLFVMHRQSMRKPYRTQQILRVFAARAGAELERQKTEAALQLSEARARASFEQVAMGIAESDMQTGKIIRVNNHFCSLTGYTSDELTNMTVAELTCPEDIADSLENIQALSKGKQRDFAVEKRYLRKDGSIFWAQTTVTLVQMADGYAQYCLGMIRDITNRKKAERALQNLIAGTAATTGKDFFPALVGYLATALNVSHAMVSELVDGRLAVIAFWANGTLQKHFSYAPSETPCEPTLRDGKFYCGRAVQQQFPNDYSLVEMGVEAYLGNALCDTQGRVIGTLCILHHQAIPNPQQAEQILQVFAARSAAELERQRTQTELENLNQALEAKVAERTAELQTSRAYYQSIIADQTELICRFLPDGILTFVNDAYCQYFRKSSEELVGTNFLGLLSQADQKVVQETFKNLSVKHPVFTYEHEVIAPDKTLRWQQWTNRAFFDDHGNAVEFQSVGRDITTLKETTAQLESSNGQLESSNKELESFAYSVSHDLRAPLRAIDGFSKALLEDYGNIFDETARSYFGRIRQNIIRMSMLIDDLLSLSRVSQVQMNYRVVHLSRLAHEIVNELQESESNRRVEVCITPRIQVFADVTLMKVLLVNLLQNAWKFTSHHATARIEFGMYARQGQPTVYFVKDDGAGFNMAYVDKLFGVFQRLHTEKEFPGTGIGLATVQRIIHRHGGQIWAKAAVEKGATFYFTLPKNRDDAKRRLTH